MGFQHWCRSWADILDGLSTALLQDTIQKERDILEQGHPDVSALPARGAGGVATGLPVSTPTVGDVALPQGSTVLLEEAGGNTSHLYVDVVGGWVRAWVGGRVGARVGRRLGKGWLMGACSRLLAGWRVLRT